MRTWGKIENRLDPNYYKKIYMDLEAAVAKQTKYKLRDFVKLMAGGVTPKVTEANKYYCDSSNGVPFLRVQNLSSEGLDWSDCKYINNETHIGLLKRSQVFEGDLLIKITGVGRMAITSVAPKGFEGNINQHIVVVKTKSPEINEQIAAFLNSDIGEMLATRRSTGGTRPALDYKALRSIPIILNEFIPSIMNKAYESKKEKLDQAQALLDSIDDYLLNELGIVMSEENESALENRMFYIKTSNVLGERLDPYYYKPLFQKNIKTVKNGKYKTIKLHSLAKNGIVKGKLPAENQRSGDCKMLQIGFISKDGFINLENLATVDSIFSDKQKLMPGDIIIVATGATIGKIAFWDNEDTVYLGGDLFKINLGNYNFGVIVSTLLRTKPYQLQIKRCITGATNGHLSMVDIGNLTIPIIQDTTVISLLADLIKQKQTDANSLRNLADDILLKAKLEVQKILLGGKIL